MNRPISCLLGADTNTYTRMHTHTDTYTHIYTHPHSHAHTHMHTPTPRAHVHSTCRHTHIGSNIFRKQYKFYEQAYQLVSYLLITLSCSLIVFVHSMVYIHFWCDMAVTCTELTATFYYYHCFLAIYIVKENNFHCGI